MARKYSFAEKCGMAIVIQHWRKGDVTQQEFPLVEAIKYAQSHGKRQDLAEYVYLTEVTYLGNVVYSIEAVDAR